MVSVWRCVGMVWVVWVATCRGFLWGESEVDLCAEVCHCPEHLTHKDKIPINCRDANITLLPDGVKVPKQYFEVDFSRNLIRNLSSTTFLSSSTVLVLDFSDNELEDLPAGVFQPLDALTTLILKNNKITSIDENAFVGLRALTVLDLRYNKINTLPKDVFKDLVQLKELRLGFNPMVLLNSTLLSHTPALRKLDLSSLGLRTIHPSFFPRNLTFLEELSLAHNHLTVVPSKALFIFHDSLTHLDLSGNPFESLGAYSFYGLSNVKTLILEQMLKLESIDAYAFGDLHHMETIVLRYMPKIQSIHPKAFHETTSDHKEMTRNDMAIRVEDFTFSFSILTTLPEDLLSWEHLRQVSLVYNQWNCDCNMKWVKSSPLMDLVGVRMVCSQPPRLRGRHLKGVDEKDLLCGHEIASSRKAFGFLSGLMAVGIVASLGTVALLVYWRRGWLCRRPVGVYTNIERTPKTITVADELPWDNPEFQSGNENSQDYSVLG